MARITAGSPTAKGRVAAAGPLKAADGDAGRPDAQQTPARLPGAVLRQYRLAALPRVSETAKDDGKKQQHRQRKSVEHPAGQPAAAQGQQREKHVQIPAGHEQRAAVARRMFPPVEGFPHGPETIDKAQHTPPHHIATTTAPICRHDIPPIFSCLHRGHARENSGPRPSPKRQKAAAGPVAARVLSCPCPRQDRQGRAGRTTGPEGRHVPGARPFLPVRKPSAALSEVLPMDKKICSHPGIEALFQPARFCRRCGLPTLFPGMRESNTKKNHKKILPFSHAPLRRR